MIRHITPWATLILCIGPLVAACSSSSLPECEPEKASVSSEEVITGYRLGGGDQVRVTVFRHEPLSGEFQLDGNGALALPLIGEIDAKGVTTRELERRIEARFKEEGYLVDPKVSVQVLIYRPFYILGEVNEPGQYEYKNGMTVTNAVALAGGYTYRADSDDVEIRRSGCSVSANPTSEVLPGEIVYVPERFF